MNNRALVNKLIAKYDTRDPYRIADDLGCIVIETPLEGIRGFCQQIHRCKIIYIDSCQPEQIRRWVCAHELGHIILHGGLNRLFMDHDTHMVSSRYEVEADRFAVDLLIPDDVLQDFAGYSIDTISECLGIHRDLITYRVQDSHMKGEFS